jgi:hypothetical protein
MPHFPRSLHDCTDADSKLACLRSHICSDGNLNNRANGRGAGGALFYRGARFINPPEAAVFKFKVFGAAFLLQLQRPNVKNRATTRFNVLPNAPPAPVLPPRV